MAATKDKLISDEVSEEIIRIAGEIAKRDGAKNITVRRILAEMGVTNRVFYNRFHNVGEVLEIIYKRTVLEMQKSLVSEFDADKDFFEYVIDISVKVLINTYDLKKEFSQYMFEFDSHSDENRIWWTNAIKEIIEKAKAAGLIKELDSDRLSYAVWCFFRGYNADAVNRNLSKEEAVKNFKFGLSCLFDGVRNNI